MRRALLLLLALLGAACAQQHTNPAVEGEDIRITFLHTSDIHSRLLPYDMTVLASDKELGLLQGNQPFGGIARIAHIIQRERARAERVVYVDSGDCFQGAPIFNVFKGEIEQRAMSQLRPDAVVIGNHEFDEGLANYVTQLRKWATYPVLATNYMYVPGNALGELSRPYHVANIGGIRIAFLGFANTSSMSSLTDVGNSLGIVPMADAQIVQEYIDFLRPNVDLVIGVSHAGLTEDEDIIKHTHGLDIVFGGHLHVALKPPKVIVDNAGRDVVLAHSGAFAKYVGKLDIVVRKDPDWTNGYEIVNHRYTLFPVDDSVPEDGEMLALLDPYKLMLAQSIDLSSVYGYASKVIKRFGFGGGDSPLGNLVAEAIRFQARTDFAMTNTLGIRTDLNEGPVTLDALYNVFPFQNTVTTLFISGVDIKTLLDYVSLRSAGRGCATQVQVAGIEFKMNCQDRPKDCADYKKIGKKAPEELLCDSETPQDCDGLEARGETPAAEKCCDCPRAEDIFISNCSKPDLETHDGCTKEPLQLDAIYDMATNDYIAQGGSGFTVLKSNNTQYNTGLPLRDAVLEQIVRSPACLEECRLPDGRVELESCTTYRRCVAGLTEFHDRTCAKLDITSLAEHVSEYCGMDDQDCETNDDCLDVSEICSGGGCKGCKTASDCSASDCRGGGCTCREGYCIPTRMICKQARCVIGCLGDADCPNYKKTGEKLHLCIDGGCIPPEAAACMDDAMCNPALLYCYGQGTPCDTKADCGAGECCNDRRCGPCNPVAQAGSTCSACTVDADCPEDHACIRDLCVPKLASCIEHRCRSVCGGDSDCPNATGCVDGLCTPNACVEPRTSEKRCHIQHESQASESCLTMSCPRAEADGRIIAQPPDNPADLPEDIDPDEPQD